MIKEPRPRGTGVGASLLLAAAFLCIPTSASGQRALTPAFEEGPLWCGTTHIDAPPAPSPEVLERAFQARSQRALKQSGASAPEIGDKQTFKVLLWDSREWVSSQFELRDKTDEYYAWVEVDNLGQISENKLEVIRSAMISQTPSGSIDPTKGVLTNNHNLFGTPPDIDGDGIVDFLIYDIDNDNVGGFVTGADLTTETGGNGRDVLHLDIFSSTSFLPRLIAHEYTHLIHHSHGVSGEETFIIEGLAEFGMLANGYTQDPFQYLSFPSEHGVPLLLWRGVTAPNGGRDYDRARLFFSYLSERIDPFQVGGILRGKTKGPVGIDEVLAEDGLDLRTVVQGFHAANWRLDQNLPSAYGYSRPFSIPLEVAPGTVWDTQANSSTPVVAPPLSGGGGGGEEEEQSFTPPTIEPGGAVYVEWGALSNFVFSLEAYVSEARIAALGEIARTNARERLRGVIWGERASGEIELRSLKGSDEEIELTGDYVSVRLVIVASDVLRPAEYLLNSSWEAAGVETGISEEPAVPPASWSSPIQSVFPNPLSKQGTVLMSIQNPGFATLRLVDQLGRTVANLHEGFLMTGDHLIPVATGELASGPYFVVLEAEGHFSAFPTLVVR